MNDELKSIHENETSKTLPQDFSAAFEHDAPENVLPVLPLSDADGSFDIDAALAAVASLHQIAHDDEAADETADETIEETARETAPNAENEGEFSDLNPILETGILPAVSPDTKPAPAFDSDFVRPELFMLERGQAASVVPAVLLMASGVWLTYMLMSGVTVPPAQLIGLALAGAGVMFLAQWLSSARFARGSFFAGWLLLGMGALTMGLFQPGGSGLAGYPLGLGVIGAAFLLTGLFTMPRSGRLGFIGLMFVLAGLAGLTVTQGLLDAALLSALAGFAPVVAGLVALVLVAPLLRRRRDRRQ